MESRLALVNAGLNLVGAQPLEFESEEAAAAFSANAALNPEDDVQQTIAAIYPMCRSTLLNAHAWSWLRERHQPEPAPHRAGEQVPESQWKHPNRYRLANPFVASIRAVYLEGSPDLPATEPREWDVLGGYLFSRLPVSSIEDQNQTAEETWPELFDTCMKFMLASLAAIPVMQDIDTARVYEQKTEIAVRNAMKVDTQSHPVRRIPRFSLVEARIAGSGGLPSGWSSTRREDGTVVPAD